MHSLKHNDMTILLNLPMDGPEDNVTRGSVAHKTIASTQVGDNDLKRHADAWMSAFGYSRFRRSSLEAGKRQ